MLSTYFKVFFNELYACSLALLHLFVVITLHPYTSKDSLHKPSGAIRNRRDPSSVLRCSSQRNYAQSSSSSDVDDSNRCSLICPLPQVATVTPVKPRSSSSSLFLSSSSISGCHSSFSTCPGPLEQRTPTKVQAFKEERILRSKHSPSKSNCPQNDIQSPKKKYSFKRKRHPSHESGAAELFDKSVNIVTPPSSPESVVAVQRRIESVRRSGLRSMLLNQDPAIDLRPLLLPEEVAQRNQPFTGCDKSLGYISEYPFQTPFKSARMETHWNPDMRVEVADFLALRRGEFFDWSGNNCDIMGERKSIGLLS